jgi:hypothetical protein
VLAALASAIETEQFADLEGGMQEQVPVGLVAAAHIQAAAPEKCMIALDSLEDGLPRQKAIDLARCR